MSTCATRNSCFSEVGNHCFPVGLILLCGLTVQLLMCSGCEALTFRRFSGLQAAFCWLRSMLDSQPQGVDVRVTLRSLPRQLQILGTTHVTNQP